MTDDDALIARIRALSDVAYWANVKWIIPGDATQAIGKLAVEAADRLEALTEENGRIAAFSRSAMEAGFQASQRAIKAEAALAEAQRTIKYLELFDHDAPRRIEQEARIAAEAALAERDKDAERYRYLRDVPWTNNGEFYSLIIHQRNTLWDAAIDAALKGKP